ncbi:hypothetical protein BDW02DRAFT_508177 [Decorospora gaudefroyi]|uniref:Uncharacterized protein n=1 Tax=Decorospora gaudefroyi TaxID=184978 RepID=A0A6A5K5Y4_9PLEO|nr:hypothetical protein BDW02DRAFT_508177 [Decorospora gaudefroyi]
MRHPAAPTIIAVLLGFLAFMVLWSRVRGDGHHEGNPHPDEVPPRSKIRNQQEEQKEEQEQEGASNEAKEAGQQL